MPPFIQEEVEQRKGGDESTSTLDIDLSKLNIETISAQEIVKNIDCDDSSLFDEESSLLNILKDRKLVMIGAAISVLTSACLLLYTTTKEDTVEIEELPTIKADYRPIKERVERNNSQQDKKIYTYLTSEKDGREQRVQKSESVISIKELNNSKLTEADKQMILKAFDDLAPNADRRKHSRRKNQAVKQNSVQDKQIAKNVEIQKDIPNERIGKKEYSNQQDSSKNIQHRTKRKRTENLTNFINEHNSIYRHELNNKKQNKIAKLETKNQKNGFFVQIASLPTFADAKREHFRLKSTYRILNSLPYKINTANVGGAVKYRVMIGPFRSRSEADRIVTRMKQEGLRVVW